MKIQACPNCKVRVGIGSNGICPCCKKPTDQLGELENADSIPGKATESNLQLWNPSAAANWSLLLSPAFGAYLHAANWKTLGDTQRASDNRRWIWITVTFLLFNILTCFFPTSPSLEYVLRIASLGILIFWYFGTAKPQVNFVKKKFGKDYKRRSWGVPLMAGVGVIGLYLAACVAISVAVFAEDPGDIADALEIDVRRSMVQEFAANAELKNVTIESVSLTYDEGESYVGFAQISNQGRSERLPLLVKFDGRMMTWQLNATQ